VLQGAADGARAHPTLPQIRAPLKAAGRRRTLDAAARQVQEAFTPANSPLLVQSPTTRSNRKEYWERHSRTQPLLLVITEIPRACLFVGVWQCRWGWLEIPLPDPLWGKWRSK